VAQKPCWGQTKLRRQPSRQFLAVSLNLIHRPSPRHYREGTAEPSHVAPILLRSDRLAASRRRDPSILQTSRRLLIGV
jgi:hypothetical protein